VYCAQSRLIGRLLAMRERGVKDIAAHFARLQTPESRIDIVRRIWQQNLDATLQQLDVFDTLVEHAQAEPQLAV
jgi:hypothetical protein